MLSPTVQDAMNTQVRNELFSAYQYLSMSAYCESLSLPGFALWMRAQAQEEVAHALKFYDFILDRGGRVTLQAIAQPAVEFNSPLDVFQKALTQERDVTGMINELYGLALGENDYASLAFLQWFVTEQVEEEKNVGQVVDTLNMVRDKTDALLMLDRELGKREAADEAE